MPARSNDETEDILNAAGFRLIASHNSGSKDIPAGSPRHPPNQSGVDGDGGGGRGRNGWLGS